MSSEIIPVDLVSQPSEEDTVYDFDLSQLEPITPVPFSDLAVYIPNLNPYVGYDGVINKAATSVTPEKGLLCILRPYLEMQEFDFVELYFGHPTVAVASLVISDTQAANGLQIPLYVPPARLLYGPVEHVYLKVTPDGGNEPLTSIVLKLFVDNELPAGPNPSISTPYHDFVDGPIFEQHILDNGIRLSDLVNGIKVTINTYPNRSDLHPYYKRRVRDRIILRLNGHVQEHSVTDSEAASDDPIHIRLYHDYLSQLGDGDVIAEYTVIDEAGNVMAAPSPIQLLQSYLGGGPEPLEAPFIDELDQDGKVNVDLLNGLDATIGTYIRGKDFNVNDRLIYRMEGHTHDGNIVVTEYTYDVSSTFVDARVRLPNAHLTGLVRGQLRLSYRRQRAGVTPDRPSRICVLDVIGLGTPAGLDPAEILQASDGNLPADSLSVTFFIRHYPGQDRFDAVTVYLIGSYANGQPYYQELGPKTAGTSDIYFDLQNGPLGPIAGLEGGELNFYYTVTNERGTRPSEHSKVDVGDLVASLRKVDVNEAPPPHYTFDPAQSHYGANVIVRSSPLFTRGSTVTLYFMGSAAGGSTSIAFPITPVWESIDLPFDISRYIVLQNLDRSATIYYILTKPGQRNRLSHSLEIRVGSVIQLPAPGILESTVVVPGKSATINPIHVSNPPVITVRVTYSMLDTDTIQPYIKGKMGVGSPSISPKPGNAALGFVDFNLSNIVVAAHLGENFIVDYVVTRGGSLLPSDPLDVNVLPLPDSVTNVVTVPQAVGGQVNVNTANTVQVLEYPFMRRNQPVWISFEHDDGTSDHVVRNGDPVTLSEYDDRKIVTPIPNDYLKSLPDGSPLRIKTQVSMDGLNSQNSTVRLNAPAYSIKRQAGIVTHIDVGAFPSRLVISPDGSRVYVTNRHSHTVSVISTATHKVIHTIPGLNQPEAIAVSPDGRRLYVSNLGSQSVTVINTTTYSFISQMTGLSSAHSILLNRDGSRLYVASHTSHALYTHDTRDGSRLHTLSGYINVFGLAFNPDQTRLYANSRTMVHVIDTSSNTSVTTIAGFFNPRDMAYSPHNTNTNPTLYVTNFSDNNVHIINARTNIRRKILPAFSGPYGIVMHPTQPLAYVINFRNNTVTIIDTIQETVIDTILGFNSPIGMAISRDGSTLYVANSDGGTVTVINT